MSNFKVVRLVELKYSDEQQTLDGRTWYINQFGCKAGAETACEPTTDKPATSGLAHQGVGYELLEAELMSPQGANTARKHRRECVKRRSAQRTATTAQSQKGHFRGSSAC